MSGSCGAEIASDHGGFICCRFDHGHDGPHQGHGDIEWCGPDFVPWERLEPCPFCGGPAYMKQLDPLTIVGCDACGVSASGPGPLSPGPKDCGAGRLTGPQPWFDLAEMWNTRQGLPQHIYDIPGGYGPGWRAR